MLKCTPSCKRLQEHSSESTNTGNETSDLVAASGTGEVARGSVCASAGRSDSTSARGRWDTGDRGVGRLDRNDASARGSGSGGERSLASGVGRKAGGGRWGGGSNGGVGCAVGEGDGLGDGCDRASLSSVCDRQ